MIFKSSLILATSAMLASSLSAFAAPETGMEAFHQLIGELESKYSATCEGEEVVRCTDTAGRIMELTFTEDSQGDYTFDVTVNGKEYEDLSQLKRVSPELIAELQPMLDQTDLGDQNDEEEATAASAYVNSEQALNYSAITTGKAASPGKNQPKQPNLGGFYIHRPYAKINHHPRHALAIRGCNTGPKIHKMHVKVRHQPRFHCAPKNNSNKSGGKRG